MGRDSIRERLWGVCAGVTLLVSLLAPPGAPAAAPPLEAGVSNRTVAEVAAYWTPERMAQAKPLELVAGGEKTSTAPRPTTAAGASSPVPYTSFELTDTTSFPNRVHGKVFFTRPGVGNFVCSGTVVDAVNRATVITAGHCVHGDGSWSTNFAFAPGYRNLGGIGNAPYGVWAASDESAPEPWVDSQNLKYDVGAAVIARDGAGRSLQNVVGARPVIFNQPTAQFFRSHAYPAEPAGGKQFDGKRLWACDSNPPLLDNPGGSSGPSTMGIGCDMTGGASGGGWVTRGSSGGYLNGVNSYRYANQPNLMYGPYFGATVRALYEFAVSEPPGAPGGYAAGNKTPGPADAVARAVESRRTGCDKVKKAARKLKRAKRRLAKRKRAKRKRAGRACRVEARRR